MTIFRSKLHRKWAAFFTAARTAWEYAPVPTSHFWLPEFGCWFFAFEEMPTKDVTVRLERLNHETKKAVILACGDVGNKNLSVYCADTCDSGGGIDWWEGAEWSVNQIFQLCINSNNNRDERVFYHTEAEEKVFERMKLSSECHREASRHLEMPYRVAALFDL